MRNNSGFTLLEIMVSMTILAVGIIAVMQLFPAALHQSQVAAERTTIASLARSELGRVHANGVGKQLATWAAQNALRELTQAQRAYSMYDSWRANVTRVGGDVDLFRITFQVTMFDGREEKFVTYITEQ